MRPYSSAQPFFRDRSVRRRIKAYSTFASLDRGMNVGASKKKLGSRVKLTAFSVHFLFSAACELWRHSRDSISPGWTLGRTPRRRPHSVLAPYPGKSPASSVPICGKTDQRNHLQQTEKEMVWGQVWVSPSSRSIQLPSS